MKAIHALIAFLLICLSAQSNFNFTRKTCKDYGPTTTNAAFSLDFCRATEYDTSNNAKCCFLRWEDSQGKRKYNCVLVSAYDMADIDEKIKSLESSLKGDIKSLDCKSSYIYGSLLLVLFFLL